MTSFLIINDHLGEAQSRTATPLRREEPDDEVQASGQDAARMSPWGGFK